MELLTRKNNRLKNYDYSENGWYFITVCSKDRENIFGKYIGNPVGTALAAVRDDNKNNIKLSKIGQIIDKRDGASPSPTISNIIGSFKSKCSVEYLNA